VFEKRVLKKKFAPTTEEVKGNGENYTMRNFMICTLTQQCSGNKIENNEIGGARSTYGGEERCIRRFDGEN